IIPCAFTTLDWLRVESCLLFFPYDNSEKYPFADQPAGDTLWELGLDFTVSPTKGEFRGGTEHARLKGRERFKIFGVLLEGERPAAEGDTLWAEGRQVGVITCAMYSKLSNRSMGIARLEVPYAEQGVALEVRGSLTAQAIAHTMPFDDPEKNKRTAKG
ncbi:MAG: aminomethyl transferase family protein, partial [Alphaproteobacteria bacterium]|nr:aminomethyl transferase family protein [Alphaproteobacteria bacterium]